MNKRPSHADLQRQIDDLQNQINSSQRLGKINRVLFEIANAVSITTSLTELFSAIHRSLATIIDATNFFIAFFDKEKETITFPYHVDDSESAYTPKVRVSSKDSLTARVIETKSPVLITKEKILEEQRQTGWQIISGRIPDVWLGVPLVFLDRLIGVMAVQSYLGPTVYDQTDVKTMCTVAAQVAIAIERKRIDQEIESNLHRFKTVIEKVPGIAVLGYDRQQQITFWNAACEQLFGYAPQEAIGADFLQLLIPLKNRPLLADQFNKWLQNHCPMPSQEMVFCGKSRDVAVFSSHVRYQSENGDEMFCINMDLTSLKQAEASLRSANANFQAAMDSIDAAVYVADLKDYRLLFLNTKVREHTGAEVGNFCYKALQIGQDVPCTFCTNDRLLDSAGNPRPPYVWELQNTRNGRWYQCRDQAILWPDGRLVRLEIAVDITERKAMEASLKESEERFRILHDASLTGICIHDGGVILDCNRAILEMSGFTREELLGTDGLRFITPGCQPDVIKKMQQNYPHPYMVQGCRKDGTILDIRIHGKEIPYKGRIVRVAEFTDLTPFRQAERALAESERNHRIVFENSPLGMIYINTDATILDCNARFVAMMGIEKEKLLGQNVAKHSTPLLQSAICKAMAGEQASIEDFYSLTSATTRSCFRVIFNPINPGQNPTSLIATFEDITERKIAEQVLRESAERFRTFFSAINDAVFVYPLQETGFAPFIETNDIACERYGYSREEFKFLSMGDICLPEHLQKYGQPNHHRELLEKGHLVFESIHIKRSGMQFPVEINARVIEQNNTPMIMAVVRDISERKQAEQQRAFLEERLQQAQRLESIGRLAGGIAHDFNNMLGVIIGRTEMVMDGTDGSFRYLQDMQEIKRAAEHSANLTKQLLTFARKQAIVPKQIDISQKITESLSIIRRLIGENIEIIWQPNDSAWQVNIDAGQIDQILTNLCVNARDAINGSGRISIHLENVTLPKEHGPTREYVVLSVSDTGCGMDEEVLANLFEPFFTTKEIGKGTGLGLATTYGIVNQNQGFIRVKSVLGEGSIFTVYLPRSLPLAEHRPANRIGVSPSQRTLKTVLLVEDEPGILELTKAMVERLGYRVLVASTPGKAIRLAADAQRPIDILLTDIIMPEMDGLRLSEILLEFHPKMELIFMSGYTDDVIAKSGVDGERLNFIPKPFTRQQLAEKFTKLEESLKPVARKNQ